MAFLNDGSESIAAVNWSDGVGFTANAQLEIANQGHHIKTALDQSTAGAIDYIHIAGAAPRIVGTDNSSLKVTIDNTYTTKPNFMWSPPGGEVKVEFVTNSAPLVVCAGGGKVTLADGSADVVVVLSGEVVVSSTFTIATGLYVIGGNTTVYDKIGSTVPIVDVNGGTCHCYRLITNGRVNNTGRLTYDHYTAGETGSYLEINGGQFSPVSGSWNYVYKSGGSINTGAMTRALSLPAISGTNDGPGLYPTSGGLLTVTGLSDRTVYATAHPMQGQAL